MKHSFNAGGCTKHENTTGEAESKHLNECMHDRRVTEVL